jgi:hypothetical protein
MTTLTATYTYPVRRLYRKGPSRIATDSLTVKARDLTEAYTFVANEIDKIRGAVVTDVKIVDEGVQ